MAEGSGTRWSRVSSGADDAQDYRRRFAALEAEGADLHGEARFVDARLSPRSQILDAGCGFGRVGGWLRARGHTVVGVDADEHLIALARAEFPRGEWLVDDLARLRLERRFDGIVLAGNVVPFLADGTLPRVMSVLAAHLRPGGLLVSGFSLAGGDLPRGAAPVTLDEYDAAATAAGLRLLERCAGWDAAPYAGGGYAVIVHHSGEVLPPRPESRPAARPASRPASRR